VLRIPSFEELEGAEGIRGGLLNQRFIQSSLEPSALSFYRLDHSMLCNVLVGDL
jgi:hypothetical protein